MRKARSSSWRRDRAGTGWSLTRGGAPGRCARLIDAHCHLKTGRAPHGHSHSIKVPALRTGLCNTLIGATRLRSLRNRTQIVTKTGKMYDDVANIAVLAPKGDFFRVDQY